MTEWKSVLEAALSQATPATLGKVLAVIVADEIHGDELAVAVLDILIEENTQKMRELEERRLALCYRSEGWTAIPATSRMVKVHKRRN